jgi:hypothetical protein
VSVLTIGALNVWEKNLDAVRNILASHNITILYRNTFGPDMLRINPTLITIQDHDVAAVEQEAEKRSAAPPTEVKLKPTPTRLKPKSTRQRLGVESNN